MTINQSAKKLIPLLILIMIFFLFIQYISYYWYVIVSHQPEFVDTDCFMRLVRVEQLADTGDWFDSTIHRSNSPYGETLHWTRPLDILLLAGAYILTPFMGFEKGLMNWGIVISPFLGMMCLIALTWATSPFMNLKTQQLLWILFIGQKILFQIFTFGRPDHHSLLALLFILLFGFLYRMGCVDSNRKYSILGGLMAALSFWVSVESIFFIILVFLSIGTLWVIHGQPYARRLFDFSAALLLFSSIFLLVERPLSSLFTVEYDKISVVHIFVFLIATIATYLISRLKSGPVKIRKIIQLVVISIPAVLILWMVFPDFFRGPMAGINPAIVPIWLSGVSEVQPILSSGIFFTVSIIGPVVLASIYLVYLVLKHKDNTALLVPLITGAALFIPLTLYQLRMAYHLMVIMVVILTLLLHELVEGVSNLKTTRFQPVLRVVLILVFVLGFPAAGLYSATLEDNDSSSKGYDLAALCGFLNNYRSSDPDAKCILTDIDFGPTILYRTDYQVIATPYHRNDAGILYSYQVMATENDTTAERMLAERSVDLLILCPDTVQKRSHKKTEDKTTFYEQLLEKNSPDFLRIIELPQELADSFIVYRVVNP